MDVDLELKLLYSLEHIKETLINSNYEIDRDGGILNMEPFPSPLTLARLASAVYSDEDVVLPEGWKLLTTASNMSWGNGYVGAAYLNPSLQQVVLSHRGTNNFGAVWTNFKGVVCTKYSRHMNSAITFADKIMTVLCQVNEEKGAGLQLSVTGHSLGGWLSQVTAFTLQNVRREGNSFTKIYDRPPVRHVHTVTFDTPGCRDMLGKIMDDSYYRHRKTVSPDELDITNYLAPENRINTFGSHVGTLYLVYIDVSGFDVWKKYTSWYNIVIHKMENFVKALSIVGKVEKVVDWPVSGVLGGKEFNKVHEKARLETNFVPVLKAEEQEDTMKKSIRHKTEKIVNSCDLRVFTGRDLDLLYLWSELKAEKVKMTEVSAFVTKHTLGNIDDLFAKFDIKNRTMVCESKASIQTVIRHAKQLTRWFPEFLAAVKEEAQKSKAGLCMYRMQARSYLASLPECGMSFKDIIGLERFLKSGEKRCLHIISEDSQFHVSVVHKLLSKMSHLEHSQTYLQHDHQTFLDWEKMQDLKKTVDLINLFKSGYSHDDLLVIDLADANPGELFSTIFKQFLVNGTKKLIIISSQRSEYCVRLSLDVPYSTEHCEQFRFEDLTEDSKKELFFRKMLIGGGKQFALADYSEIQHVGELLSRITEYTNRHEFKIIITDQNYTIQMEDPFLSHDDLKVHSMINKEVSMERVTRMFSGSLDTLLVVGGIGPGQPETDPWKQLLRGLGEGSQGNIITTAGDGESIFKQKCREEPSKTIYWLSASAGIVHCKTIYKNEFYIKRKFANSKYTFDFEKFEHYIRENNSQNALFVVQNGEQPLMESNHIMTTASDEETDDMMRNNPHRPVHVLQQGAGGGPILWQRSRGSLEALRPCVTAVIGEPIPEGALRDKKVVIIADEPGMGKSTTLTSVALLLRPDWVVRVNLKDILLENLPKTLSLNSVCEFILSDNRLRGFLHFYLNKEYEHARKIYIFFDGFDEIKRDIFPNAEEKVFKLLEYLNNETTARVWVTTRPYRREIPENALSTFSTQFQRITEKQKRNFLVAFWRPHLLLEVDNYGNAEKRKLHKCAKFIYKKAKKVLGDDIRSFMGIPLQMRMLADVCLSWVTNIVKSNENIVNKFEISSVLDLYQRFSLLKYDIYFSDKTGLNESMSDVIKKTIVEKITEKHRMLGFRVIFPKFAEDHFGHDHEDEDEWTAELCRVGLVQAGGGGAEFTHRTLAEYHCAELAVEWLRGMGRYHGHAPVAELLLTEILVQDSYRVIRIFIDQFVISEPLSEKVNELISLEISKIWQKKQYSLFNKFAQTALHVVVEEGSAGIVQLLLGGFRCAPERLIGFLAAQNWVRREDDCTSDTALGRAARAGRGDMVRQIVGSLERCSYQVILELLLATYVSYDSVSKGEIQLLSNYLQGTADCPEIKRAFTRTEEIVRVHIPALHAAVLAGRVDRVGAECNKLESGVEMLYCLLGGEGGFTVLRSLAKGQTDEKEEAAILAHISTTLWSQNISALGRAYSIFGETPLHLAAEYGRLDLVEWLIHHGVWVDCPRARNGDTALWWAAREGQLAAARCLMEKGADINIINHRGENLLFLAAQGGNLTLLYDLIHKGLNVNCVNNAGENLLFPAAYGGNLTLLQVLIHRGLNVNCVNNAGENLLFPAIQVNYFHKMRYHIIVNNRIQMLQYLIDKGLDVNCINNSGENLLDCTRDTDVEHFLEQQMAQRSGPGGAG